MTLDAAGRVTDSGGADGQGGCWFEVGAPWDRALAPGCRVLWATSQWPALQRAGRLDEVVLELGDEPGVWLSSWWRDGSGYKGWLLPHRERRQLLADLHSARRSLSRMPGALLQLRDEASGSVRVTWASDGLLDLLGVTPEAATRDPQALVSALCADSQAALSARLQAGRADRAAGWRALLSPRRWPERVIELNARWEGEAWHAVLTDVTERERLQRALLSQALTDALTQLPNRAGLLERLQEALGQGQAVALFFIDCDRFKQVNDALGHATGDELLQHLATRLTKQLRLPEGDAAGVGPVLARFGGDEFVLAVPGVFDEGAAMALAHRLMRAAAHPFRLDGHTVHTSVSVGMTLSAAGGDAQDLLRQADLALYEAKRQGRGRAVLFDPAMRERVEAALALEADLRQALRRAELRPVFQPIVEIASGRVVGLEALARWRHPVRGEVPAAQFVAVAEECGLASALGLCMLRKVCEQLARWRAEAVPLPARVSVNLSRAQLRDAQLADRISDVVAQAGVPAGQLQFEVTESLAMDDADAVAVLHRLRALGYRLALDDFGTGHSSLAALPRFPVQQLKIDRSFVRELLTSGYHRALVQAALQVAHALGLEVVAEGVETEAQARALAGLGCARAQGWLYAKAVEADAVPALLASGAPPLGPQPQAGDLVAHVRRGHHVVVTDAQGLTTYVNAAFTLTTGYTLQDMAGRTPGSVLQGPDADPRAVQILRDAVHSGTGCLGVEIVNHRKDGSAFTVRLDIEPVRDATGRLAEFVSVQTEVGELQQVRSDLAAIRRREDEIRATGIVGFWERDLVTGQAVWDDNTRQMMGYRPGDAEPSWDQVLAASTPQSRPALQGYVDAVTSGQTQGTLEYSLVRGDGREVDLLVRWRREGHRVLGVMIDVSGSEQRRRATRLQLQQVALATEAAQQLCWVSDPASRRIQWLGATPIPALEPLRACEDWGRFLEQVVPRDRPRLRAATASALAGDRPVTVDLELIRKLVTLTFRAAPSAASEQDRAQASRILGSDR